MTNKEYTLHDGRIISVVYDDNDICRVTRECMELLIGLYQQGRNDAIDDIVKNLSESEDTILSDRQYYALMEIKKKGEI